MAASIGKKIFRMVFFFIFLVIAIFTSLFFFKDKNGKPMLSLAKIKKNIVVTLSEFELFSDLEIPGEFFSKSDDPAEVETEKLSKEKYIPYKDKEYVEMYKYKDEKGVLHFTDKKPRNTEFEVMYMPVSKDEDSKDGFLKKFFKSNKAEKSSEPGKNEKTDKFLSEAKQLLENTVDQYKKAPETLNEAKELKKNIEDIYEKREKVMEE